MSNRLFVDTSVLISALIGCKGPSRELICRCLLREFVPLMGNRLFTDALTEFDIDNRFQVIAARGKVSEGLQLLDKLDRFD
ncbi:MAG: hypothetical protein VKL42_17965 [Snowella sp.]|nr:hypothetical protein [Snowella sp.]